MRRFFVVLVVLLTSFAGVVAGVTAAPAAIPAAQATNAETTSLINDINSYRATKGLPAIPVSPELTKVATDHVHDLMQYGKTAPEYTGTDCVPHGWSSHGPWTGGCYKYADSSTYPIMWNKPKEIANYPGNGYEILYWSTGTATAADALQSWQSDGPHNDVIINQGIWKDLTWRAMGVWVEDGYASVWFGEQTDPTPTTATTTQPANANATKPTNGGAPQLPAAAATTPANGGAPVLAPAATSTTTPTNGGPPSATSTATTQPANGGAPAVATTPANGGAPAVATTPANGGAPVLASTTTSTKASTNTAAGGAPALATNTTGGQQATTSTLPAGASPVTAAQLATPVPNSETTKLIDAINAYRATKGLAPIPVSPMLTTVAMDHVHDLMQYGKTAPEYTGPDCLPHSWSSHGPWTGGCYKSTDPSTSPIMWNKPKEIANYPGNGYEILYETTGTATAADALKAWQADAPHDNVIINQDIWKNLTWRAMGVWVEDGYASVWFGEQTDPTPAANVPAQPANNATMPSVTATTTATTTSTATSTATSTLPPATSTSAATQTMVVTQPATMIPTLPVTLPATMPATVPATVLATQ